MKENPFLVRGYASPELFCDRESETDILLSNIQNGVDTTLISPRKYGKTGLIFHTFRKILDEKLPISGIYVDIFATLSLKDFIKALSEAILVEFPEKTSIGGKFLTLLKGYRPIISYDPANGMPQLEFNFASPNEKEYTLKGLLNFLNVQKQHVALAIDEFQQITEYPEKNVEALLRTYTQQMHNISFIYCGSKKTIMAQIFSDAARPFYSSTRQLSLDKIDSDKYSAFIREKFLPVTVDDDAMNYILEWTRRHTFYTQSLCNEIFAMRPQAVSIDVARKASREILEKETSNFLQIRSLVTDQQWRLLIAIAKEQSVRSVASAEFLAKYHIGSATNARRNLESLTEKELLLETITPTERTYFVYNVFLSRWLERTY
ncbi:MAG: ATP-binding protein [Salinivirgaceae bacterium]|nr:ATP-binding protein [Salinivirgaceae bacterium]MBR5434437.1 ATP-binding protein [Bacteroidales bacterium]